MFNFVKSLFGSSVRDQDLSIEFNDYFQWCQLSYEWADSYDCRDWNRLRQIIAPHLDIDYSTVNGNVWHKLSGEEFISLMSHQGFLGDKLVDTQHLLGGSKFRKVSEFEAIGTWQLRAAHQRYKDLEHTDVADKGHGHCVIEHKYKKIDGIWRFAGLKPDLRWNEHSFDKMFPNFDGTAIRAPDLIMREKMTKSAKARL